MGAKRGVGERTSHGGSRSTWRSRLLVLGVVAATVAIPFDAASASAPSAAASGPVVKVGMITSLTGPIASTPEVKDALLASIAAFNKRGGVGTNNAKLEAVVCDTKGDANGEVACARQMVDDGVVATLNDLTFNNPAGVVDVLEAAAIPRIGVGGTDVSEFG
jgi:branched-chain amino acid transport system substrate-binding protein